MCGSVLLLMMWCSIKHQDRSTSPLPFYFFQRVVLVSHLIPVFVTAHLSHLIDPSAFFEEADA